MLTPDSGVAGEDIGRTGMGGAIVGLGSADTGRVAIFMIGPDGEGVAVATQGNRDTEVIPGAGVGGLQVSLLAPDAFAAREDIGRTGIKGNVVFSIGSDNQRVAVIAQGHADTKEISGARGGGLYVPDGVGNEDVDGKWGRVGTTSSIARLDHILGIDSLPQGDAMEIGGREQIAPDLREAAATSGILEQPIDCGPGHSVPYKTKGGARSYAQTCRRSGQRAAAWRGSAAGCAAARPAASTTGVDGKAHQTEGED